ncbi:hypothetical protein Zmor_022419 [Zophobas morio]|uniref:Uncharacterized protein n=1 Tax=Zophobas morio TaxID=2755281 RepID=A0AA38M6B1_9CUCU|nr:hypothetical protein Zmor_022419 [Zophobas morio]
MVRKANKVIGIGEKKFGHDYKRRMMIFDSLIKSVFMYAAEIWGWREYEEVESARKILEMDIGRERRNKKGENESGSGKRAVGFEEKFSERSDCKILQECWKEIRKEGGKHVWNERDKYYACE